MRVVIDENLCSGHARCAAAAPDLIPLDESGFAAVTDPEVPAGKEDDARAALAACPERAITIVE